MSISNSSKILYGEINGLCHLKGYCWAENSHFARVFSVDKNTITTWIGILEKRGYVKTTIDKKSGNKRKIEILSNPRDLAKYSEVPTEVLGGHDENIATNFYNNSNNKTIEYDSPFNFLMSNCPMQYRFFHEDLARRIDNPEKFIDYFNLIAAERKAGLDLEILSRLLKHLSNSWLSNSRLQIKKKKIL